MKDKINQFKNIEKEITVYVRNCVKEHFKGKLKPNESVTYGEWVFTRDNKLKIFYKLSFNDKFEYLIIDYNI